MVEGCQKCGACCHNHTVLITPRDLREIHQHYPDIDLKKAICLLSLSEEFKVPEDLLSHYPIVEISPDSPEDPPIRGYLALKFNEISRIPQRITQCIFYSPSPLIVSDHNGCVIHEHKPLICRSYPFQITDDSSIEFHGTRCPQDWNWGREQASWDLKELLLVASNSYDEFFAEINSWEQKYNGNRDIDAFLEIILTK